MEPNSFQPTIKSAYADYNQLLDDIKNDNISKSDLYEKIMQKENTRIDLINRIVNNNNTEVLKGTLFYNLRFVDILGKCAVAWKTMLDDIILYKRQDLHNVLFEGDRKLYFGLFIISISLVMFFISISS